MRQKLNSRFQCNDKTFVVFKQQFVGCPLGGLPESHCMFRSGRASGPSYSSEILRCRLPYGDKPKESIHHFQINNGLINLTTVVLKSYQQGQVS